MAEGARTRKNELSAGISRRRLLRLAAYSVPAASVLSVAGVARAEAISPVPGCPACSGTGLALAVYSNPNWYGSPAATGVDTPCHPAPWYPLGAGTPRFSARWGGNLCIDQAGQYHLRVRGTAWAYGFLFDGSTFVGFGPAGATFVFACADYPVDILFKHGTNATNDAEVYLEWMPPGQTEWSCVPAGHLR